MPQLSLAEESVSPGKHMAEDGFIPHYVSKILDGVEHQVGPHQTPISALDSEWEEGNSRNAVSGNPVGGAVSFLGQLWRQLQSTGGFQMGRL